MPYDINNQAAFAYLKAFLNLALPVNTDYRGTDRAEYAKLIGHMNKIKSKLADSEYNDKHNYLSLYTTLHELAEKIAVKEDPTSVLNGSLLTFHQQFFIALYENDNKLFEGIDQQLIHDPENKPRARASHIHEKLKVHNINKPGIFQFTHPENWANKLFSGLMGIDYNPLKRTNTPYIAFKDDNAPTLLRMGTQVQGMQTLQPAFQNFLAAKKSMSEKPFHHVYINLLKRNMKNHGGKFERYFERAKSKALEKINDKSLGAAVITLPADNATFFEGYSKSKGKALDKNQRFNLDDIERQLIDSITHNKNDFNIPDDIKAMIFRNGLPNDVRALFQKSVIFVLGDSGQKQVTAEQRQAIVFDFVKFGLTNLIAQKLNPDTMNVSCKDAIDRGGVHALWYEFRRRMESGKLMSEREFNMHLDASALLVKGRPVNDHRVLIWNVINQSFLQNPKAYEESPWVKQWLVNNYPVDKETKALESKQSKGKLSKKEQTLLDKHLSEVAQYRQNLSQVQSVSTIPHIPPILSVQASRQLGARNSKVFSTLDGLSPHLEPTPTPVVALSHSNLNSLHQFLKYASNENKSGISHVKERKPHKDDPQPGISFEMTVESKPLKVIAKQIEKSDALLIASKRPIPLENMEAFALELVKVVLPNAQPGCTFDFSVASPEKKPILERVFREAIANAVKDGKYNEELAPKILTQRQHQSVPSVKKTL